MELGGGPLGRVEGRHRFVERDARAPDLIERRRGDRALGGRRLDGGLGFHPSLGRVARLRLLGEFEGARVDGESLRFAPQPSQTVGGNDLDGAVPEDLKGPVDLTVKPEPALPVSRQPVDRLLVDADQLGTSGLSDLHRGREGRG